MGEDSKKLVPLPPVGTRATRSRTITEADIASFAESSGDLNPIHLDAEFASKTLFGKRVAHGMMVASLISAVLGMDLPGPGSIYLGQTLKFMAPVHIGDTITATVEVLGVREDKRLVTLRTDCTNQDGQTVIAGEAHIKYMREEDA